MLSNQQETNRTLTADTDCMGDGANSEHQQGNHTGVRPNQRIIYLFIYWETISTVRLNIIVKRNHIISGFWGKTKEFFFLNHVLK